MFGRATLVGHFGVEMNENRHGSEEVSGREAGIALLGETTADGCENMYVKLDFEDVGEAYLCSSRTLATTSVESRDGLLFRASRAIKSVRVVCI
jgi:hypothetical protein